MLFASIDYKLSFLDLIILRGLLYLGPPKGLKSDQQHIIQIDQSHHYDDWSLASTTRPIEIYIACSTSSRYTQ